MRSWGRQAANFRLQASIFRLQASDFKLQTAGFRLQSSSFKILDLDSCHSSLIFTRWLNTLSDFMHFLFLYSEEKPLMKKLILSASILAAVAAYAQPTLTTANINGIGASHTYFVADSNASNLDGVTGAGVTWDYSSLTGFSTTVGNDILDATTAPHASDFPTSTKADELENNFTIYQNQTADTIFAQGYTFSEPSFGDAIVQMSADNLKWMQYPFNFNDSFTDSLSGTVDVVGTFPLSGSFSGEVTTTADGHGTLLLGGNTYTNVLRVKFVESSQANLGLAGIVDIDRVQYYYYQPGSQNFPVFIHTSMSVAGTTQNVVYSQDMLPTSVEDLSEVVDVNVYPNPVVDQLNVGLNSTVNFDATVAVKDILGKTVHRTSRSS